MQEPGTAHQEQQQDEQGEKQLTQDDALTSLLGDILQDAEKYGYIPQRVHHEQYREEGGYQVHIRRRL